MMEESWGCGFGFHIGCIAWALGLASHKEAVGPGDNIEAALDHVQLSKCASARIKVVAVRRFGWLIGCGAILDYGGPLPVRVPNGALTEHDANGVKRGTKQASFDNVGILSSTANVANVKLYANWRDIRSGTSHQPNILFRQSKFTFTTFEIDPNLATNEQKNHT